MRKRSAAIYVADDTDWYVLKTHSSFLNGRDVLKCLLIIHNEFLGTDDRIDILLGIQERIKWLVDI